MYNNNYSNWKSALDQLSSLPGDNVISADDNAWEKLNGRLSKKKKSPKANWYLIAAACVLGSIPFFYLNHPKNNSDQHLNYTTSAGIDNNNSVAAKKIISPLTLSKSNDVSLLKYKSYAVKHKSKYPTLNKLKITWSTYDINKETSEETSLIKERINPLNKPLIVQSNKIIFPELKNVIPLVHINDLDKPTDPVRIVADNKAHSFKLRLFNRDALPPASEESGATFFKIKISP